MGKPRPTKAPKAPKVIEPKFYELSADSVQEINDIIEEMALPFSIKREIVGTSTQKCLIKIQKTGAFYNYKTGIELTIFINEDYLAALGPDTSKILIHQQLDRIETDIVKGTFKIGALQFHTNIGIINKYGIETVVNANQLSGLYTEQKNDDDGSGNAKSFDINSDAVKQKLKSNKNDSVEFLN